MSTDKRKPETPENPLKVFLNSRHSIHFDDIEFQRRFEQNLIRHKLGGETVTKEQVTIAGTGIGGGGSGNFCYWTLEGSNLVRYGGNVGIGIHPHSNDFEVRGNALIEAVAEQPYLEIRNWSDTEYDPVIQWAVGATPVVKFTAGVDDSDSDKWKLSLGSALGTDDLLLASSAGLSTPLQFTSTLANGGVSPFAPTSKVVCTNLNADMVDGYHLAYDVDFEAFLVTG